MKIYFTPSNHRCRTSYNGSYPQGGLAMEAFTVFMLKFLRKKMKVLLYLKIEKQNKVEREKNFCKVLLRKVKRNERR